MVAGPLYRTAAGTGGIIEHSHAQSGTKITRALRQYGHLVLSRLFCMCTSHSRQTAWRHPHRAAGQRECASGSGNSSV